MDVIPGMIRYTMDKREIASCTLTGFFQGWRSAPDERRHRALIAGSAHCVAALDGERVVGFITALSDGVLTAFIPLLEVLPAYQGKGIGTELVCRMLRELNNIPNIDLTCDAALQAYYRGFGMMPSQGMILRKGVAAKGESGV